MAQKRKRNKKWISWVILLVLFVAAGAIVFLVWDNYFNDKKDNSQENEKIEKVEKKENNEEKIDDEKDEAEKVVEQKKVEQYDGEDPNKAEKLSGAITFAGVVDDKLVIRMNIDQFLESGECGLTLSRSNDTIYSSIAEIIGGPSTASCAGFDVPVSELGGGKIDIIINLKSNERSGVVRGEANI